MIMAANLSARLYCPLTTTLSPAVTDQSVLAINDQHGYAVGDVVGRQHVGVVAVWPRHDGVERRRKGVVPHAEDEIDGHELARPKRLVGIGKGRVERVGVRRRLHLVVDEAELPLAERLARLRQGL